MVFFRIVVGSVGIRVKHCTYSKTSFQSSSHMGKESFRYRTVWQIIRHPAQSGYVNTSYSQGNVGRSFDISSVVHSLDRGSPENSFLHVLHLGICTHIT